VKREFDLYKRVEDLEKIKYLIATGRKRLPEVAKMISLVGQSS
jgi:hypothetical protein